MIEFEKRFSDYVRLINDAAKEYVSSASFEGRESEGLKVMLEAMAYSLNNGGKRIRPMLTLEFCRVCGGNFMKAVPLALAAEMIHTYSLIHDDLPCMDNDDFRRGKPSCHKVYGEEFALLAGDALQPLAFSAIALAPLKAEQNVKAAAVLAEYCGINGMVGGQTIDLNSENKSISIETLQKMHKLKTGALIKAACVLGCIAAENYAMIECAEKYAEAVGYAFQIRDDILDVIGDADKFGKPIGSDADNGKTTYVSAYGLERSQQMVDEYTDSAIAALSVFGEEANGLRELAKMLACREK